MSKKYMEEVLGIMNQKAQQKLRLRMEECNKENPDDYIIHGWGRAAEGQLGTNPSKEITKPLKIKLPADCKFYSASGNYTFAENKNDGKMMVNYVDEKSNKTEWRVIATQKIWSISSLEDSIVAIGSASNTKIPQRES